VLFLKSSRTKELKNLSSQFLMSAQLRAGFTFLLR
jgi:hypothetical protein